MPSAKQSLHGVLVVDKPGRTARTASPSAQHEPDEWLPTSHDIVQRVRRLSGQRRIGHTGTLDPMASGVLVLCLGQATRLVEYYQGHAKQYYAEVLLGAATNTYDALGQITQTLPVPALNHAQIENALQQFRGSVLQSPPVYSALKQGGESVHRKARRGETVVLAPRPVTITRLALIATPGPDRLCLRVNCSAGTYVRSLAHDLGLALGTVAHLAMLRREAAGSFALEQAHSWTAIEQAAQANHLTDLLLPPGFGLELPRLALPETICQRLSHGQRVVLVDSAAGAEGNDTGGALAQAYNEEGNLVGIIRHLGQAEDTGSLWKAEKWFVQEENAS